MTQTYSTIDYEKTCTVEFVKLDKLQSHEALDPIHLEELKREIKSDGILKFAIAVDRNRSIILDGHHRVAALKDLGCMKIPAVLIDYDSSDIQVRSQRRSIRLTKKDVIKAGTRLKKLPPKTSNHMIRINGTVKHISAIEKQINIPLSELKETN